MGTFLPRVYQDGCSPSVCSDDFVGKSNDLYYIFIDVLLVKKTSAGPHPHVNPAHNFFNIYFDNLFTEDCM